MSDISVVLWGMGSMGSGMGRMLAEKTGVRIAGGIASREKKSGEDIGDLIGLDRQLGVKATNKPAEAIDSDADVVLNATGSFREDVREELEFALERGCDVISIAEEMAYPQAADADFADELDRLARENGVSLLGTGINPGFVLDLLIITLSGACFEVEKIEASRVNDLSPFGPTVMKTQGVGTTVEEFEEGVKSGEIVGHIGFRESIEMVADRLGWQLDSVEESREPIVSETHRETEHVEVEPGMVAGCRHIARGIKDGQELIVLKHPQQIHPDQAGVETGDYIKIYGDPGVDMAIQPEIPGGKGTMAVTINMIPQIVKAEPGLRTMADLPVPGALMGDVRELI